ncbi:MAG: phosphoribosyltransferase family protein [Myxococcaceae bacterium]
MLKTLEKFIDALWPTKCLNCEAVSGLRIFCRYCEPSIKTADTDAAFLFTGPIRNVIHKAKFSPDESKARQLMRYLPCLEKNEFDGIVFVPIHWRRRLTRGFDLSALFAQTLSKQLKIPVFDWLKNTRFDKPLTLSISKAERVALTRGRYELRKNSTTPKNILLVDDVMTTGATLEAAKSVLVSAGHQVTCFSLAKTPLGSKLKSI